tara:strand:+ start:1231 stop:1338 length:108 start_codon:yes stop_codon:yes gene_type:complete
MLLQVIMTKKSPRTMMRASARFKKAKGRGYAPGPI